MSIIWASSSTTESSIKDAYLTVDGEAVFPFGFYVREGSPNKATMLTLSGGGINNPDVIAAFAPAADLIGGQSYPIQRASTRPDAVYRQTRQTVEGSLEAGKVPIALLQTFESEERFVFPTIDELDAMTFLALVGEISTDTTWRSIWSRNTEITEHKATAG